MPYHIIKRERDKFNIKKLNIKKGNKKNKIYTYEFTKWHNGKRYRKQIKVLSSIVDQVYKKWLDRVFLGEEKKKFFSIKECVEVYKDFCLKNKSQQENLKTSNALDLFLNYFSGGKNIEKITLLDMDKFCSVLANKYKNSHTYNRMLVVINAFFNFLRKREVKISLSIMDSRRKKVIKRGMVLLGVDDYNKIINLCEEEYQKTFINLAFFTGMRHQEILTLKWEDVFLDRKFILLKAKNAKSKKSRVIPIIPFLEKALTEIKRNGDYVVSFLGNKLSTFSKKWSYIKKKLKIDYTIHDLRHHFITLLFSAGVNPREIQEIAGHATLSQTMEYAFLSQEYQKERASNIGVMLDDIWTTSKNVLDKAH